MSEISTNIDENQDVADEGVLSGVESEQETTYLGEDNDPFDPESISITSKTVALETVLRRIRNNTIKLAPDFQREYVWDIKRKSQLIESMMLKIPLPMFYVSEDKKGIWEVVDGLQRLTTIRDFVLGEDNDGKGFILKELEFWSKNFDGKNFFQIDKDKTSIKTVNNILETELSFIIINPETPEKVKRNIFKRINTGGMRLSNQEIRHALYQGRATKLLKIMESNDHYHTVLQGTVKDNRMAGRELILRYLSFYIFLYKSYKGDMDDFLANTMRVINGESIKGYENIKVPDDETIIKKFEIGLDRAMMLFGDHAFRKSIPGDYRKTPVNKSLFELWLCLLSKMKESTFDNLLHNRGALLDQYSLLFKDEAFVNSISRYGSSVLLGAKMRREKIVLLIQLYRG